MFFKSSKTQTPFTLKFYACKTYTHTRIEALNHIQREQKWSSSDGEWRQIQKREKDVNRIVYYWDTYYIALSRPVCVHA